MAYVRSLHHLRSVCVLPRVIIMTGARCGTRHVSSLPSAALQQFTSGGLPATAQSNSDSDRGRFLVTTRDHFEHYRIVKEIGVAAASDGMCLSLRLNTTCAFPEKLFQRCSTAVRSVSLLKDIVSAVLVRVCAVLPICIVVLSSSSVRVCVCVFLQHIWGGETTFYSHVGSPTLLPLSHTSTILTFTCARALQLLNAATAAASDKLVSHAKSLGATAIINVRYETATTMNRIVAGMHASVMAYGTAVVVEPRKTIP